MSHPSIATAPGPHGERHGALRIALAYLALSGLWILTSDTLVELLVPGALEWPVQTAKGLFFVVASAAVVYALSARELRAEAHARRVAQRAERDLAEAERRYHLLYDEAPHAYISADPEGRVRLANRQAAAMLRTTPEELVGRHVLELYADTPDGKARAAALRERYQATGRPAEDELEMRAADGTSVWTRLTAIPLVPRPGFEGGALAMAVDITEERRLARDRESRKEELERLVAERTAELALQRDRAESADRVKSAFLASMSHELRTPLNAILGFTGLLLQRLPGPVNDEQERQLSIVRDAGNHLLSLINDVLDLSKIEAAQLRLERRPFEVGASVEAVARTLEHAAREKGLRLHVDAPPGLGQIEGDRRRFEQVLLNLLGNAVRFTESGWVSVTARASEGAVEVAVADSGVGIAAEQLEAAFEPFRQIDSGPARRHGGTGLGLAICRRLATLMGGTVSAESEPGRGSTFTLTVPRATPTGEAA